MAIRPRTLMACAALALAAPATIVAVTQHTAATTSATPVTQAGAWEISTPTDGDHAGQLRIATTLRTAEAGRGWIMALSFLDAGALPILPGSTIADRTLADTELAPAMQGEAGSQIPVVLYLAIPRDLATAARTAKVSVTEAVTEGMVLDLQYQPASATATTRILMDARGRSEDMKTITTQGQAASAQSELKTAYDIAMGEYAFQANGRFPSTAVLVRKLHESEDEINFRAISLPTATLGGLERRALSTKKVFSAPGMTTGKAVGVQVFNYSRAGARALGRKVQGTSLVLTRRDTSDAKVTWWLVSNRDERLPDARIGTFYGSSTPGKTWK